MKKKLTAFLLTAVLLTGCSANNVNSPNLPPADSGNDSGSSAVSEIKVENIEIKLTERDQDDSYDEANATKIVFSSSSASISGQGATAAGNIVSISAEGSYVLSGSGSGQVIVELKDDKAKVQLVLNNLNLNNPNGAAILIGSCDKVFITLAAGSTNVLSDGSSYSSNYDGSTVDAVIFSKSDMTINGSGSLTVNGNYKHAIVGKDDVLLYGASITVNSEATAIEGKDSLEIFKSALDVKANTDGLKSSNSEDTTKGFVYIKDSSINISASDKGIQAETYIIIDSGTLNVDSGDDCLNSNNSLLINNGTFKLLSKDDAIHADYRLTINNGTFTINAAEGLEATLVTVNDGTIEINASDDGINAAQKVQNATPTIEINGGNISINMAQGDTDAFDSNGNLYINGGTININAQSPFDYDGEGKLNGGTVYVNGQQVTQLSNQMMGRGGFGFKQQNPNSSPSAEQPQGKTPKNYAPQGGYNGGKNFDEDKQNT